MYYFYSNFINKQNKKNEYIYYALLMQSIVFYGLKTIKLICFRESGEMKNLLLDMGCILDFM